MRKEDGKGVKEGERENNGENVLRGDGLAV